jgi:hypothetical protein
MEFLSTKLPRRPPLTHICTQVHRFSKHNPADADYLCETDVSKCVWQQRWCFWAHSFPVVPLLTHICTQVHRFFQRNPADVVYLCESDGCIGSSNTTRQTLPTSAKLTYLSVYDSRDDVSEHTASPSPPSSLTYVHRCIGCREHNPSSSLVLESFITPILIYKSGLSHQYRTAMVALVPPTHTGNPHTHCDTGLMEMERENKVRCSKKVDKVKRFRTPSENRRKKL